MVLNNSLATASDKILFTPGPLTTSRTVKQAMLRDLGSRDTTFIEIVRDIRQRLVRLGEVSEPEYTAVIMQGSGTFGIEAVIGSVVPPKGKILVVVNGAYGKRIAQIASVLKIQSRILTFPEASIPDLKEIEQALQQDTAITTLVVVHLETTSGIINPVEEIGQLAARYNKTYIVDAMSSFGAVPLNLKSAGIDFLISSSNKCIEGVPGFSFILARRQSLLITEGFARSLSLDLLAQWKGLESDGQFRFTPPTHVLLAFQQALFELEEEGGVKGRAERYGANHMVLISGMRALGFKEHIDPENQSSVITSFHYPDDPAFNFTEFYEKLSQQGFVIYPGKLSNSPCFRIGTIGRIFPTDIRQLLAAIVDALLEMGINTGPVEKVFASL